MPVDLLAIELALMAPDESEREITALISVAAGTRHIETVMFKLRSVLRRLRARGYSLTIEQGLSAIGIAIAVASSAFASYMISQDHQGQREGGDPAKRASLNSSQVGHFGSADVDPITTGSIAPTTGTRRGGLSGVGDGPVRLGTSAPRLRGYVLRDVFEGVALVEGNDGIRAVKPGFTLPEGSKVMAIVRHGGKWVVVTTSGIISEEP